jgi:BirA family biotin operon repressor/biotin-[acetyl-CoA-carboxylase] ligase
VTQQILKVLQDNRDEFLSGETICNIFSISRTAVWKHINVLRKLGYEIESMSRKGYRLIHHIGLPLPEELKPLIGDSIFARSIDYLDQATSTNQILMQMAEKGAPSGILLIAEQQSEGHGRMNRRWFSPPGQNLYFSTMIRPEIVPHKAPQLALVVAAAIYTALKKLFPHLEVGIKWPNDIFISGKKVAGVLCEMQTDMSFVKHVVIGIGLNVNQLNFDSCLDSIATSVALEVGEKVSRLQVLAEVIISLDYLYYQWFKDGLTPIIPLLNQASILTGREVTIHLANQSYRATVIGIDDNGFLQVKRDTTIHCVSSGEVHLTNFMDSESEEPQLG